MANKGDIQHNLKSGADSQLFFTREVTDKSSGDYGKLKTKDGVYRFPYLTRMTGDSIKGSTEAIESNELRPGRTASKKRLGNESTEGSLDIELSPTTFDDNIAAVFKNEWKPWVSDKTSAINLDKEACPEGFFLTRAYDTESKDEFGNWGGNYESKGLLKPRRLLNFGTPETSDGLIEVPEGTVVHELTCGSADIKYDVLRKLGGVEDEDLYQDYPHMAIDSMSLDVPLGGIVTGSFNFVGAKNPKRLNESDTRIGYGGDSVNKFVDGVTTGNKFINSLPKKSTDTDQFTSLVGNFWFNGKNLTVLQSLNFQIGNNLQKKYALFVKPAISTASNKLDVTGSMSTYVVFGETEELYNSAIDNSTNEIMFLLQDKEKDPEALYLFQIFKSSFEAPDSNSNGGDSYEDSYNFTSFEERAVRILRIELPKVRDSEFAENETTWTDAGTLTLIPNVELKSVPAGFKVIERLKDENNNEVGTMEVTNATVNADGTLSVTEVEFTPVAEKEIANGVIREVTVMMNGIEYTKSFGKDIESTVEPVTVVNVETNGTRATATWLDSVSKDFQYTMVKIEKGTVEEDVFTPSETISYERVEKGVQRYSKRNLLAGDYKITIVAYDTYDNPSEASGKQFAI